MTRKQIKISILTLEFIGPKITKFWLMNILIDYANIHNRNFMKDMKTVIYKIIVLPGYRTLGNIPTIFISSVFAPF